MFDAAENSKTPKKKISQILTSWAAQRKRKRKKAKKQKEKANTSRKEKAEVQAKVQQGENKTNSQKIAKRITCGIINRI